MTDPSRVEAYAVAPPGLEDVLLAELRGLGLLEAAAEGGGARFRGTWDDLGRVNLCSAVASRVLVRVARFRAQRQAEAARELGRIPWDAWLPRGSGVEVRVARRRSRLHSGALTEAVREAVERSVGPPAGSPPFRVQVRAVSGEVVVSLDTSGDHLHRRGYRLAPGTAPLRENVAAALLLAAGWEGQEPLLDPMAGVGTLAVEAARMGCGMPAGWQRAFAFERMVPHDPSRWETVRAEVLAQARRPAPAPVFASDRDPAAVARTRQAARRAGVAEVLRAACVALECLTPPCPRGLLVADPPHGFRLGGRREALEALAAALKGPFRRWRWGILTPDPAALEGMGLAPRRVRRLRHGGRALSWALGGPAE
ncbi:THUMP domain-containing class I SAM-dependent RNA methyltransferase [Deferrisoma camini]|uniref:THUMP domain-containing class I SAM-dependent RNA methyltransferase n=1 Tax=Deferrisoma camini TaxID=1035120 RepID=UPI00046D5304|nr:RNA methyltransferase [Deferrisoma camini]